MTIEKIFNAFFKNRGISNPEDFLDPSLSKLVALESWTGVSEASTILTKFILDGSHICVWGDYDVDGTTSTALAIDSITKMRAINATPNPCSWHVPDRFKEGYGLNIPKIKEIVDSGAKILITVDCGITDNDVIQYAKDQGMVVIITDHHLPEESLPPADAICNPSMLPSDQKEGMMLAGVGMIFILMTAVNIRLKQQGFNTIDMVKMLDLVALGTIADVADLGSQNRIMVKKGLEILSKGERPGIASLKSIAGMSPTGHVTAETIAFALGPRMNAAGRMKHAGETVELLLAESPEKAYEKAKSLDSYNRERRDVEDRIAREAEEQAYVQVEKGTSGLVLFGENWHPGIVGIVASRMVEKFHLPALVCCNHEGAYKGSGRSLLGVHLYNALKLCKNELTHFGGHPMAAGFGIKPEFLESLPEIFSKAVEAVRCEVSSYHQLHDASLCVSNVSLDLIKELTRLEPCGAGCPPPLFKSEPLTVYDFTMRNGLLIMELCHDDTETVIKAKKWRPSPTLVKEDLGRSIIIYYTPKISRFGGAARIEFDVDRWKYA